MVVECKGVANCYPKYMQTVSLLFSSPNLFALTRNSLGMLLITQLFLRRGFDSHP